MRIKEVKISGFRSYRDAVVKDLSPRTNVVVGHNGSGKSNFFFAVEFVLSDGYNSLPPNVRKDLIHEGFGSNLTTAEVSILLDNTDRRFVTMDCDEVTIARRVSLHKDQLFINSKSASRNDIIDLMTSAGFSRCNRYNIIKQGKIMELAICSDEDRLKLLKEVAGATRYEEAQKQNRETLSEVDANCERIKDLRLVMEERLRILQEEKKDVKEFRKWKQVKSAVEYALYENVLKNVNKKIRDLERQKEELESERTQKLSDVEKVRDEHTKLESRQRKMESEHRSNVEENDRLLKEQTKTIARKTKLELVIKDKNDEVNKMTKRKEDAENDLKEVTAEIERKQTELDEVIPKYEALLKDETELSTDIRIMDQRCEELLVKKGEKQQFKTVEEKDEHLRGRIQFYEQQIVDASGRISDIENSIQGDTNQEQKLREQIQKLESEIEICNSQLKTMNNDLKNGRDQLNKAVSDQQNTARSEEVSRINVQNAEIEMNRADQSLRKIAGRSVMGGVDSVKKVMDYFLENNGDHRYDRVLDGYRGMLIDLFECDEAFRAAVEVTAGNRLFYHVVDDDEIALQIINEVNSQRLMGQVNFLPLNRIIDKPIRKCIDRKGRSLIEKLSYSSDHTVIFRLIFGGTVLVESIEDGLRIMKEEHIDCVTAEGDLIFYCFCIRGAMRGGYFDANKSLMQLHFDLKEKIARQARAKEIFANAKRNNDEMREKVERMHGKVNELEQKAAILRSERDRISQNKCGVMRQLEQLDKKKESNKILCTNEKSNLREMQVIKENLMNDLGMEPHSQLTDEEQAQLLQLQVEVKEKRSRLESIAKERYDVSSQKLRIENHLSMNLLRRRETLQKKISDISVSTKVDDLQAEITELKALEHQISEIAAQSVDLNAMLEMYAEDRTTLMEQLEQCQRRCDQLEIDLSDMSKKVESIDLELSSMIAKRDENIKKKDQVHSFPADLRKYEGYSMRELNVELNNAIARLKTFGSVNEDLCARYSDVSDDWKQLETRLRENESDRESIENMLSVLEARKYDAMELTYRMIAKEFSRMFQRIVPSGRAKLVLQRNTDQSSHSSSDSDKFSLDAYSAISIKVSFGENTEETMREMRHFSGGQKSVISLALIFAIQKIDSAPFYLFDEIDAALDAPYRKTVADIIHKQSEHAQFVMTTFRPELLVNADRCFLVQYGNRQSHIEVVTNKKAIEFVSRDERKG